MNIKIEQIRVKSIFHTIIMAKRSYSVFKIIAFFMYYVYLMHIMYVCQDYTYNTPPEYAPLRF